MLNQTYPISEIIVVDDCSTDETIEIVKQHKNIRILHTNYNSGAQVARNVGIKAANSDWIAFIDSDDEWHLDKTQKQMESLGNVNYNLQSVVHGNCTIRNVDNSKEFYWSLDKIAGENVYKNLLKKTGTLFPSIITSKKALESIGYLDESIKSYQEWDTAIRLSLGCNFIHLEESLFYYNIRNDGISQSSKNNILGYHFIVEKYKDDIIDKCGVIAYNDHIKKCAVMAMNSKHYKWGRKFLNYLPNGIDKYLLLVLNFFKLQPKYIYQSLRYLSWKN